MYSVISFSLFLKERATKHWISKPAHITAIWIDYYIIMSLYNVYSRSRKIQYFESSACDNDLKLFMSIKLRT